MTDHVERMLPLPQGEGDELLEEALQLAQERLLQIRREETHLKPRKIVNAVLGGTQRTRKRYHDAYTEQIACEQIGRPDPETDIPSNPAENAEMGEQFDRGVMTVDDSGEVAYSHHRELSWDTKWNKATKDQKITIFFVPRAERLNEVRNALIPQPDWHDWAARFLIFASEFRELLRRDRGRKGGEAKARSEGR